MTSFRIKIIYFTPLDHVDTASWRRFQHKWAGFGICHYLMVSK